MLETTEQITEKAVNEDGLFDRLLVRLKEALPDFLKPSEPTSFSVIKGLDGEYYWHARHTNNFKDRQDEILSEKAHLGFEARVDKGHAPMPELWSWHTGGSRQGQAVMMFYDNHIMNAIGKFDSTPEGEKARKFYERNPVELSHGFTFPSWALKDGIYEVYNTFEISTLPIGAAANPYTTFEEIKKMALSEEKRQWLESTIGKERTEKLLSDNEKVGKAVEELGEKYKDFVEVTTPAEPASEEKPKQDIGAIAQLLADILEGQAHVVEVVDGVGKALKAFQDAQAAKEADIAKQIEAVKSTNEKLQAELKLTPRAASSAPETQLSAKEAEAVKTQIDATEADPFFS